VRILAGLVVSPGSLTGAFAHGAPVATTPDIVTTVVSAAVEPGTGVDAAGVAADGAGVDVEEAGVEPMSELEEPSPHPASASASEIDAAAAKDRTLYRLYMAIPCWKKHWNRVAGKSDEWIRCDSSNSVGRKSWQSVNLIIRYSGINTEIRIRKASRVCVVDQECQTAPI
jgi:hypothetical protein